MTATLQEPATGTGDIADAVALAPTTSARNVVQGSAVDVIALIVRALAGQTAPLLVVQNAAGDELLRFAPTGDIVSKARIVGVGDDIAESFVEMVRVHTAGSREASIIGSAVSDDLTKTASILFTASLDPIDPANRGVTFFANTNEPGSGSVGFGASPTFGTIRAQVGAGQTDPLLELQAHDGRSFKVDPDGNPLLTAPDGSQWRLLVDNAGALSTVAA